SRRRLTPRRGEEVPIGVETGPLNAEPLRPLPHDPGFATANVEDAQPIADVAIVVEQPQFAVGDGVLDFDVGFGDCPVVGAVHGLLPGGDYTVKTSRRRRLQLSRSVAIRRPPSRCSAR